MRNLALLAALTFVANVLADAAPEPPPKGKKYVIIEYSAAVDKSVTGYVFAQMVAEGRGGGGPHVTYSVIKLGEKPVALSGGGKANENADPFARGRKVVASVVAIPEETAKKFATEKELTDALVGGSVQGIHRLRLTGLDIIDKDDKRKTIPWKYTITAIDAKTGITATKERDGKPFEGKEPGEGAESDEPQVRDVSETRWLIGGFFATAAFVSMGLWLVRRKSLAH